MSTQHGQVDITVDFTFDADGGEEAVEAALVEIIDTITDHVEALVPPVNVVIDGVTASAWGLA